MLKLRVLGTTKKSYVAARAEDLFGGWGHYLKHIVKGQVKRLRGWSNKPTFSSPSRRKLLK